MRKIENYQDDKLKPIHTSTLNVNVLNTHN